MRRHIRKARAMIRRYGHMSMKNVEDGVSSIRRIAKDNPEATAGLGGAATGAVVAGMGIGPAALVGGLTGFALHKVSSR